MSENKDRLIGYSNPTMVFPIPLVAVVSNSEGHFVVYPGGGHREKYEGDPRQAPDFVELSKNAREIYRESKGADTFLYGISAEHILIGTPDVVAKRLREYLKKPKINGRVYLEISEFLTSLSTT